MIQISLILNIFVLLPVCVGLFSNRQNFERVFGAKTTGLEILLSIYIAMLSINVWTLFFVNDQLKMAVPLVIIQIIYKLISVVLIRDKKTPVLYFNLVIALVHSYTLFTIFREGQ